MLLSKKVSFHQYHYRTFSTISSFTNFKFFSDFFGNMQGCTIVCIQDQFTQPITKLINRSHKFISPGHALANFPNEIIDMLVFLRMS